LIKNPQPFGKKCQQKTAGGGFLRNTVGRPLSFHGAAVHGAHSDWALSLMTLRTWLDANRWLVITAARILRDCSQEMSPGCTGGGVTDNCLKF